MKLSTALPFAVFGGFFLSWNRYLESVGRHNFWYYVSGYMAAICLVIAAAWSVAWVIDSLPRILRAVGDFFEKILHPEVALAGYVARMDKAKIEYLASMQTEFVVEPTKVMWRVDGVEMPEEWVLSHLGRCNHHFPEFPAIRKQGSGTVQQLREQAFIEFCVRKGWAVKREGQTAIWIKDWSPERVKKEAMDV